MAYVLATNEKIVRWYKFDFNPSLAPGKCELLDMLDLNEVPKFSDKETAKIAAQALGLKTWRYVKIWLMDLIVNYKEVKKWRA